MGFSPFSTSTLTAKRSFGHVALGHAAAAVELGFACRSWMRTRASNISRPGRQRVVLPLAEHELHLLADLVLVLHH